MATEAEPAYERDPYLRALDTEVVEAGERDGRSFAVLRDTVLYPEGGGQPADRGTVAGVPVLDVQKCSGAIVHTLERPLAAGASARVELDWERRFDHMQQHTGQHLLSAIAEDRFGLATTSFHLGEETCDVELAAPGIAGPTLLALGEAMAAEIRAARPVRPRHVSTEEYASLQVRSRGLPPGHEGLVRLVAIEGVDLNTCGGTHLRSTAEIELVHLIGTEPMRGGTRLFFAAGGRARRRAATLEARLGELRRTLGVADRDVVTATAARLKELRDAAAREKALVAGLAEATADALAARAAPVVAAHFEALDAGFVQQVARALVRKAPGKVALLTAGGPGAAVFALAAGREAGIDLRAVGPRVAEALGGRGGGSGEVYQGKCAAPGNHDAALALLRPE